MVLRNGFAPVSAANINKAASCGASRIPNQRTPLVQQFSGGFEYQIAGSHGRGRAIRRQPDRATAASCGTSIRASSTPATWSCFRTRSTASATAYLEQIATNGKANYNALQVQRAAAAQRRAAPSPRRSPTRARKGNFLDHLSAGGGATGNVPAERLRHRRRLRPAAVRHAEAVRHQLHLRAAGRRRARRSIPAACSARLSATGTSTAS